jgi:hypothetical protein
MTIIKIVVPLAFVIFLSYTQVSRHLMHEGGWCGFAVVLLCIGGMLLCYGVALIPIAPTFRVSNIARLLAEYPGPVTLKASRTARGMMVLGVVSFACCMFAGVMAFLGQQAGNKAAGDLAASAIEMGFWGLLAGALSVRALLSGTLQLDRNGFQATLISRKQYLWTEVYDFRTSTSGVQFNVVGPPLWFASSNKALGDNYGLEAAELADLMTCWQSAALDGPRDERPLAPAVPEQLRLL